MATPKRRASYNIGLITVLPCELAAVTAMLDEHHKEPEGFMYNEQDEHCYTFGAICGHNVVVAHLGAGTTGVVAGAATAKLMRLAFPEIKFVLLIGIGGGVPGDDHDIRQGDVVVSQPTGTCGGVFQFDHGRSEISMSTSSTNADTVSWQRKDFLNKPPDIALQSLHKLQADHLLRGHKLLEHISKASTSYPKWKGAHRPTTEDPLFSAFYHHIGKPKDCSQCDRSKQLPRCERDSRDPMIHYGVIASGSEVVKNAYRRTEIAERQRGTLCIETEAAGLMSSFPCLVIRGISDFADSHKNDGWQEYASATAAAFAKEFLSHVRPIDVSQVQEDSQIVRSSTRNHSLASLYLTSDEGIREQRVTTLLDSLNLLPYAKYKSTHLKVENAAHIDTWITCQQSYSTWRSSEQSLNMLCVSAHEACGKSVQARHLVDQVLPAPGVSILYYFFNEDTCKGPATFMSTILHQLFMGRPDLLQGRVLEQCYTEGPQLTKSFSALWQIFCMAIEDNSAGTIFLVIDAFECYPASDRDGLLAAFTDLAHKDKHGGCLKVLLTCRPYSAMRLLFAKYDQQYEFQYLRCEDVAAQLEVEISAVIADRIKEICKSRKLSCEQDLWLQEAMGQVSRRSYLEANRVLGAIQDRIGYSQDHVQRTLQKIHEPLDEDYKSWFASVNNDERAQKLIDVLTATYRVLTVEEVSIILSLRATHQTFEDLRNNLESFDQSVITIRDLGGPFVEVFDGKVCLSSIGPNSRRPSLITKSLLQNASGHFPLQKGSATMLKLDAMQSQRIGQTSQKARNVHRVFLEVCVHYLKLSPLDNDHFTFLEYCLEYLCSHLDEAALGPKDSSIRDVEDLLQTKLLEYWNQSIIKPLNVAPLNPVKQIENSRALESLGANILSFAAYIGCLPLAEGWILNHQSPSTPTKEYFLPLYIAAARGHLDIVHLLLESGANVQERGSIAGRAIHAAAFGGSVPVIEYLLKCGASINSLSWREYQPLHFAVREGRIDTVKALLENGANLRAVINNSHHCLDIAIQHGNVKMVLLLLEYGLSANGFGDRQFPMLVGRAVRTRHPEIADLLMQNLPLSTNPECYRNEQDWASCRESAAMNGDIRSLSLLLDTKRIRNQFQSSHLESLLSDSRLDHYVPGIVHLVLTRLEPQHIKALSLTTRASLLQNVASYGDITSARILLNANAPVNASNVQGWTALHRLAIGSSQLENGTTTLENLRDVLPAFEVDVLGLAHMLIERGANPLLKDSDNSEAAFHACMQGKPQLHELLTMESRKKRFQPKPRSGKLIRKFLRVKLIRDAKGAVRHRINNKLVIPAQWSLKVI